MVGRVRIITSVCGGLAMIVPYLFFLTEWTKSSYRTFVNKGKRKGRLQSSRPYAKVARRFTLEGGFHEGLALLRVLPPNLIKEPYPVVSLLNISTP
jgi:hypothetical protein